MVRNRPRGDARDARWEVSDTNATGPLSTYLEAIERLVGAVRELLVDRDIAQKIIAITEIPHSVNMDAHHDQLSVRLAAVDKARESLR